MAQDRLAEIRAAVGDSRLAWFGTRGVDALPLQAIKPLEVIVSQIAPAPADLAGDTQQDCLENRLQRRLDLDRYDIDDDLTREPRSLKTNFLAQVRPGMIIVAYRPAEFLSAASFVDPRLVMASNFHLFQRQFEHKPWVERALSKVDATIPMVPTIYVRDTDQDGVRREAAKGPMVGRTSTGSGGAGVFLFESELDFAERLPPHRDGFVAVSPFLDGAAPLNVNACVYGDGVAVFGVSLQLIGVQGLTSRRFGFCGNDFAAAAELDTKFLDEIERITLGVGGWLQRLGYRGLFGLDVMIKDGRCYVSELNPRFQASTALSAGINQALGLPDPTTEHVAAFLNLPAPKAPSCKDQTLAVSGLRGQRPLAQVLHRNVLLDAIYLEAAPEPVSDSGAYVDAAAARKTTIDNEAMMFRTMHDRAVTKDGYSVDASVLALGASARRRF